MNPLCNLYFSIKPKVMLTLRKYNSSVAYYYYTRGRRVVMPTMKGWRRATCPSLSDGPGLNWLRSYQLFLPAKEGYCCVFLLTLTHYQLEISVNIYKKWKHHHL